MFNHFFEYISFDLLSAIIYKCCDVYLILETICSGFSQDWSPELRASVIRNAMFPVAQFSSIEVLRAEPG